MKKLAMSRALKRILVGLVATSVSLVALMAFAHTKPGRPLLRVLFGAGAQAQAGSVGGGCPLGFDGSKSTPEERDAARKRAAEKLRGDKPAAARPALGFVLDKTTRAEVEAWASKQSIACRPLDKSKDLDCAKVPPEALPQARGSLEASAVWFRFDANDKLINVASFRYTTDPQVVSSEYNQTVQSIASKVGPPTTTFGEPTAENLSKGLLVQTRAKFAFTDYLVETWAMQVNYGKYLVKDMYQSLNLGPALTTPPRRPSVEAVCFCGALLSLLSDDAFGGPRNR